jgi:hypothetical protein
MRLITTPLAAAATVALTGTALAAATTTNSVQSTMKGTVHLAAGKLTLTTQRKPPAKQYRVTIHYDVHVLSKTVLGLVAYPCKNTSCIGSSTSTITLAPGSRHVTFNGHVEVVKTSNGRACVFAQLRDLGPSGKAPGKIVHTAGGRPGVTLCQKA